MRTATKKTFRCGNYVEEYTYERPFFVEYEKAVQDAWDRVLSSGFVGGMGESSKRSATRARKTLFRKVAVAESGAGTRPTAFVTLTFKRQITAHTEANRRFKLFIMRLNYYLNTPVEYVTVLEFQKNKRIHYHMLLYGLPQQIIDEHVSTVYERVRLYKTGNKVLAKTITSKLESIYGEGFLQCVAINNENRLASIQSYLVKYFAKDYLRTKLFKKRFFTSRGVKNPIAEYDAPEYEGELVFRSVVDSPHRGKIEYKLIKTC